MKKKIIRIVADARHHLGDDLVIRSLVRRYPGTAFLLCADSDYQGVFAAANLHIINKKNIVYRALNGLGRLWGMRDTASEMISLFCDAIVQIDDSHFTEYPNWREAMSRAGRPILRSKQPRFLLNVHFGSYENRDFYKFYQMSFADYHDICFRDTRSAELFSTLTAVRSAPDMLFCQQPAGYENGHIVISVLNLRNIHGLTDYANAYETAISRLCTNLSALDIPQILLALCPGQGDADAVRRIYNGLNPTARKQTQMMEYGKNPDEILSLIAGAKCVVTAEFQAMALGWAADRPVFPVVCSAKTRAALEDLDMQEDWIDIVSIHSLTVERVLQTIHRGIRPDRAALAAAAANQFARLDAYLAHPAIPSRAWMHDAARDEHVLPKGAAYLEFNPNRNL